MTWDRTAQRRLSSERGTILKDWGGRIPVALIYPNTYYIGMSNLGFQTVYGLLNSYDDIVCERAFCEGDGRSLESGRPLEDFAVIAFSISSELDYFNVVNTLASLNVPLYAAERGDADPLVLAGGPCVSANPEPLAPFFDCLAIGEGEVILPPLVEALADEVEGGRDRLLQTLCRLPGLYVPCLNQSDTVCRQWARDIDAFATTSVILTPDTEFSDMYLIEVMRGCRWGCRFCLAGFCYRPPRFRSVTNLVSQARTGLKLDKRIGLMGASVSDHPHIDDLVLRLRREGAELSASSLRVRPLSRTLLEGLADSGATTVALAPEAGSERLRRAINKGISDSDIMAAVDTVAEMGFRQLKLYFMIGLPTETETDIGESIHLSLEAKQRLAQSHAGTRLTLTVEPFVPKAGTPFQWLPMASPKVLSYRLSRLSDALEREGIQVRAESVPWAVVQGVLSRGDRRLAAALARMTQRAETSLASWRQALAECSLEAEHYVGRDIPFREPLPWGFIDSGVNADYLRNELERALAGEESPPCPSDGLIDCHKCGVC